MLNYLTELEELVKTLPIQNAISLLIEKYSIPYPTNLQNVKRYIYPTANSKLLLPVVNFPASFRLGETKSLKTIQQFDGFVTDQSYVLEVCNDDTKTFSSKFSDITKYATFWLSRLTFPCYVLIDRTDDRLKTSIITGKIYVLKDDIIFSPIIYKPIYLFYERYPNYTNITILNKSTNPAEDLKAASQILKDIFSVNVQNISI